MSRKDVPADVAAIRAGISAFLDSAFAKVREEERARCAGVCETLSVQWHGDENPRERLELGGMFVDAVTACAAAIREGGSNES